MLASETKAEAGWASFSLFSFLWFPWAEALAGGQHVWRAVYAMLLVSGHMMWAVVKRRGSEQGDGGCREEPASSNFLPHELSFHGLERA